MPPGATRGHSWFEVSEEGCGSGLGQRNVDAANLALGTDLHDLLVAACPNVEGRGKTRRLDKYVDRTASRRALEVAVDVAVGFAPKPDNPVALGRDVAGQVEFVAVAGAMQSLLQIVAGAVDL
jgi:hypothetical protein